MSNKFKPVLLLVLVFIAGTAVGVIGTRFVARHFLAPRITNPDWLRDRMFNELSSELSLTPEQKEKVHQIFKNSQRDLQELRKEFGPRFGEIMRGAEKQVAETLTPEQRTKYEKLLKEKRALWRPHGGPQKPPPIGGRPRLGDRPPLETNSTL